MNGDNVHHKRGPSHNYMPVHSARTQHATTTQEPPQQTRHFSYTTLPPQTTGHRHPTTHHAATNTMTQYPAGTTGPPSSHHHSRSLAYNSTSQQPQQLYAATDTTNSMVGYQQQQQYGGGSTTSQPVRHQQQQPQHGGVSHNHNHNHPPVVRRANHPLCRLTVDLLKTYKHINKVYYERHPTSRRKSQDSSQRISHSKTAQQQQQQQQQQTHTSGQTTASSTATAAVPATNGGVVGGHQQQQQQQDSSGGGGSLVDDKHGELITTKGDVIQSRYRVEHQLGKGSFGQVVEATDLSSGERVALKIIKGKKAFFQQAQVEITVLSHLNRLDPEQKYPIVRMKDHFVFKDHQCIVFELLSNNLYDVIRQSRYKGIKLSQVRSIGWQILHCQHFLAMSEVGIIHCDLKPENVLLCNQQSNRVKIIDFGSSCFKNKKMFVYIQSRFYRSPEVILGLEYGPPIDMWSVGCILAELLTGDPLFGGLDVMDQMYRICLVRGLPPKDMIARGKETSKFFTADIDGNYVIKSPARPETKALRRKTLEEILRVNGDEQWYQDKACSPHDLMLFCDLIDKMLCYDPALRLTPAAALHHDFFASKRRQTSNSQRASVSQPQTHNHHHQASGHHQFPTHSAQHHQTVAVAAQQQRASHKRSPSSAVATQKLQHQWEPSNPPRAQPQQHGRVHHHQQQHHHYTTTLPVHNGTSNNAGGAVVQQQPYAYDHSRGVGPVSHTNNHLRFPDGRVDTDRIKRQKPME